MENYDVVIRKTLEQTVSVVAESMDAAKKIVERDYRDNKYNLDASDILDVHITTLYPK